MGILIDAAPADEGGVDAIARLGVDVEAADSFGAAPPFVAGEGVEVDVEGLEIDGEEADGLGGIDEGEAGVGWVEVGAVALVGGVGELAATEGSDVGEGQDLAVVPEDVAEDDEAGGGAELGGEVGEGVGLAVGVEFVPVAAGDLDVEAALEFLDGGDDAGVFAVAEDEVVVGLPVEAPEGDVAADRDVFGEGDGVGGGADGAGDGVAEAIAEAGDGAVGGAREGAEALDVLVGGEDGVEAGLGEGALAAVVEVGVVLEGWVLLAVGFELAVEWGHGVALWG